MIDRQAAVYRLYDTDGRLLYVGRTMHLHDRVLCHRRRQSWGHEIERVDAEWFRSELDALLAEGEAIVREHPIHNKVRPFEQVAWRRRAA